MSSMAWWDSYRAVFGAELRAAAHEYTDHGWPVIDTSSGLCLRTGGMLDVLEVSATVGRAVCARLRQAGEVVPVAATPAERWWFPVAGGATLPAELSDHVTLHTKGAEVLAPPSEVPDGWVHWRVPPGQCGYRLPDAELILTAVADAVRSEDREGPEEPSHGAVAVAAGS